MLFWETRVCVQLWVQEINYTYELSRPSTLILQRMHLLFMSPLPLPQERSYVLPYNSVGCFPAMFSALDETKHDLGVQSYAVSMTTLEEVFFQVVGWLWRSLEAMHNGQNDYEIDAKRTGPFARSLAPLTHSLALQSALLARFAALMCSLLRSLRSSWERGFCLWK